MIAKCAAVVWLMSSMLFVQYLGPHAHSNDKNVSQVTVACITVHSTFSLLVTSCLAGWVGVSVHLIIWSA